MAADTVPTPLGAIRKAIGEGRARASWPFSGSASSSTSRYEGACEWPGTRYEVAAKGHSLTLTLVQDAFESGSSASSSAPPASCDLSHAHLLAPPTDSHEDTQDARDLRRQGRTSAVPAHEQPRVPTRRVLTGGGCSRPRCSGPSHRVTASRGLELATTIGAVALDRGGSLGDLVATRTLDKRRLHPTPRAPGVRERDLVRRDPKRIQYTAGSRPAGATLVVDILSNI
jgi:hypothetical protein